MALSIYENYLCIPLQKEIFVSSYDNQNHSWDKLQLLKCQEGAIQEDACIQCCSFSPCGRYFGICLSKDIIIYNTHDWSSLCSITTDRKGISIRFFPKSNMVVLAEKSGNVKFFKFFDNKMEKVDLILGHNSMLTDVLVTDDEKFVITCDRDEKIRVTNYPNIYNIQCFCLGHTEFISSIDLLPSDKNILVSSSGDGTIRFWKITTGEELSLYAIEKPESDKGNNACLIKITSLYVNKSQSLIAVLEYASDHVSVLKVTGCVSSTIEIEMFRVVKHTTVPSDVAFWQGSLISLIPNEKFPLVIHDLNGKSINTTTALTKLCDFLTLNRNLLLKASKKSDATLLLFKYRRDEDIANEPNETKKVKLK